MRVLGFGYEDPVGGPSAKGAVINGNDPTTAVRPAIESPTMTARLSPEVSVRPLSPAEIAQLGLPAAPPWIYAMPGARPLGSAPPPARTMQPPPGFVPVAHYVPGAQHVPGSTASAPHGTGKRRRSAHPLLWVLALFGLPLFFVGIASARSAGVSSEQMMITLGVMGVGTLLIAWPFVRMFTRNGAREALVLLGVVVLALGAIAIPMRESRQRHEDEYAARRLRYAVLELCRGGGAVAGTTLPRVAWRARSSSTSSSTGTRYYSWVGSEPESPPGRVPQFIVCSEAADEVIEQTSYRSTSGRTTGPISIRRVRPASRARVIRVNDAAVVYDNVFRGGEPGPFPMMTRGDIYGTSVDPAAMQSTIDAVIASQP